MKYRIIELLFKQNNIFKSKAFSNIFKSKAFSNYPIQEILDNKGFCTRRNIDVLTRVYI